MDFSTALAKLQALRGLNSPALARELGISGAAITRGLSRNTKSPDRSASKEARARSRMLHVSGGPDGIGAAASSARVHTPATCGWAR